MVGIAPWTPCPAVKGRSLDGMGEIKAAVHGVGASTYSHDPREAGAETVAGLARRFWKDRRLSALWASERIAFFQTWVRKDGAFRLQKVTATLPFPTLQGSRTFILFESLVP